MADEIHLRIIIIILGIAAVWGHCPPEKIEKSNQCVFKIDCVHSIRFELPSECPVSDLMIDLRVRDPQDDLPSNTDISALGMITTLRTSGHLLKSNLTFLDFMPRLKHLFLSSNNIIALRPKAFYHLNRLELLDMSHNSLRSLYDLFKFENRDNMLKRINLMKNDINKINIVDFEQLDSLLSLDLSHNKIEEIFEGTFANLINLQQLKINNNLIINLNGALNDLKSLRKLFLENNQLEEIDVELELKNINYHLETLDFSGNKVTELNPTVFWRHWLHFDGNSICKIYLSNNNITNIPNATSPRLTDRFTRNLGIKYYVDVVTEVDLSKNNIKTIEYNAFQDIEKLQTLDVSSNKMHIFYLNPDHLHNLKRLNMSKNFLENLFFDTFSKMTQLENLDVSGNEISKISADTFKHNINLKHINFTFNNISEVRYLQISFNSGDGGINFSNNQIQSLTFGQELKLARLFLQHNKITDMTVINLSRQFDLKHLQISNNFISTLNESSVRLPKNLVFLDLSQNKISSISPSTFADLEHLVTLRLAQNNLQTLEFGIFRGLKSLNTLDLSFNRIVKFCSKVFTELKMLKYLLLKYNQLTDFDDTIWISHEFDLLVYIDGNNLSCEWLSTALKNYYRGYSKMKPTSAMKVTGNSVDGIHCRAASNQMAKIVDAQCGGSCSGLADERLLMINKQILEAIKNQTYYLQHFVLQMKALKKD